MMRVDPSAAAGKSNLPLTPITEERTPLHAVAASPLLFTLWLCHNHRRRIAALASGRDARRPICSCRQVHHTLNPSLKEGRLCTRPRQAHFSSLRLRPPTYAPRGCVVQLATDPRRSQAPHQRRGLATLQHATCAVFSSIDGRRLPRLSARRRRHLRYRTSGRQPRHLAIARLALAARLRLGPGLGRHRPPHEPDRAPLPLRQARSDGRKCPLRAQLRPLATTHAGHSLARSTQCGSRQRTPSA